MKPIQFRTIHGIFFTLVLVFSGWLLATMPAQAGTVVVDANSQAKFCWKDSYGRGVGAPADSCKDPNRSVSEALCYNKCPANSDGKGVQCVAKCPQGLRDDGAFTCLKQGEYGVGAGFAWNGADGLTDQGMFKRCEAASGGAGSCEKDGAIVYPKCRAGFQKVGCCVCSPICPQGFTNLGVGCAKPAVARGIGSVPDACLAGKSFDAGLCYNQCNKGYDGVGPVCWGQCPRSHPVQCGLGCATSQADCAKEMTEQVVSVLNVIGTVVGTVLTGGAATAVKAGATIAVKNAIRQGVMAAADEAAKKGVRTLITQSSKEAIKRNIMDLAKDQGKALAEGQAENLAKIAVGEDFDYASLDPTGIASLVQAYNKPICKSN